MIRLNKLYSSNDVFDAITFKDGINIILGERSEVNKTNGVGKSVCIEFINFCLMKDKTHSRVMLIDDKTLPKETIVHLDTTINKKNVIFSREISSPDTPTITINGKSNEYTCLDDALNFLNSAVSDLSKSNEVTPTFREFMSILIRDEKSEFQDILKCFNIKIKAPDNLVPHLFLLNLELGLYKEVKSIISEIFKSTEYIRKIKSNIGQTYPDQKLDGVRSELNSLVGEIDKMKASLEGLQSLESFESIQDDVVRIENDLDNLRIEQQSLKLQILKIEKAPKFEEIDSNDIKILYDQFKEGLGQYLQKTLDQVQGFKKKIDDFQTKVLAEKLDSLNSDLSKINMKIKEKDNQLSENVKLIANEGVLRNLKNSLSIYDQKNVEASKLRSLFNEYDSEGRKKKRLLGQKSSKIVDYDFEIESMNNQLTSFENTILELHSYIMGNKRASFKITTVDKATKKEFIEISMRIFDDGSRSVDREKVFIYDLSLLIDKFSSKKHPRFLIHDNIFDVDQDTMIKSFNYLNKFKDDPSLQYIFTFNKDKIENKESITKIELDFEKNKIASFTKTQRFLKKQYQENK